MGEDKGELNREKEKAIQTSTDPNPGSWKGG